MLMNSVNLTTCPEWLSAPAGGEMSAGSFLWSYKVKRSVFGGDALWHSEAGRRGRDEVMTSAAPSRAERK